MQWMSMMRGALGGLVTPPEFLEAPAIAVQRRMSASFEAMPNGEAIERALHGRPWLGHPLHPLLTDLVTGAWTVAWFFDLLDALGARRLRPGADAAIALGLAGVPPTALAGAADWHEVEGPARRLGFVHAMLNTVITVLYTVSLVQRLRGRRRAGHVYGHVAFAVLNISAYLGGELVYDAGVNVAASHTQVPRGATE